MNIYLLLALEFFKTGLFAIGGGPATIPFLSEMCDKYGWFTHEELTTMIAVSETTPGPVGVNMATYVGYTTAGIPGGILRRTVRGDEKTPLGGMDPGGREVHR